MEKLLIELLAASQAYNNAVKNMSPAYTVQMARQHLEMVMDKCDRFVKSIEPKKSIQAMIHIWKNQNQIIILRHE